MGNTGPYCSAASPCSRHAVRSARVRTSPDFPSVHAVGPVARASASVSATSRPSTSIEPTACATASMVTTSPRSRRVATSGSSRWWRTSVARTSTSSGGKPMRVASGTRHLDPVGRPGRAAGPPPAAGRSGSTRSTRDAAIATVSRRCRSSGEPVVGVRCGRHRTVGPLGQRSAPRRPTWSSDSITSTAGAPAAKQVDERAAPSSGQGTGITGVSAATTCRAASRSIAVARRRRATVAARQDRGPGPERVDVDGWHRPSSRRSPPSAAHSSSTHPGDRPGRSGDPGHQRRRHRRIAERLGHRVLVFEAQHLA